MRTAAMVRIFNDMRKLEMWLSYYSKYFDDLYVFACLTEAGATDALAKKYKFELIGAPEMYSIPAHVQVWEKQVELLGDHDWVLYADSDEYVIPTKRYKDLRDFMEQNKEQQTHCMGYEVFMDDGEKLIDYGKPPVLKQRKYWYGDITGSYNKPALSRIKSNWVVGFHKLQEMSDMEVKEVKRTNLYLVHLKHIDEEVATEVKARRGRIPSHVRRTI